VLGTTEPRYRSYTTYLAIYYTYLQPFVEVNIKPNLATYEACASENRHIRLDPRP
jgi:hypothetical protein